MKHLTVEIEKRFKKQLSKRFNPRNATSPGIWWGEKPENRISVNCCLCDEYWSSGNNIAYCEDCPFYVFEKQRWGCLEWITKIVGKKWSETLCMDSEYIEWDKENDKQAIELLKKLREKAERYIIWTENTK